MSTPKFTITPAGFFDRHNGFTVTNTTIAQILLEAQAAAAATGNSPLYSGGCTLIDLTAASTDGTARDIDLFTGEILTTQSVGATGAMATTATTNGTVTRASGDFIADGWKPGQGIMPFAPDTAAQVATGIDGILGIITAVAALTITISGTPWAVGSPLTTGTRLIRVARAFRAAIAINSGNTNALANVSLLGHANDSASLREKKFGPTSVLIGAMVANVSALPAMISTRATYARY